MNFFKKFSSLNIITQMLIGLVIGTVLGILFPASQFKGLQIISILGDLYINSLKAIAPLLVFFLIIDALDTKTQSEKSEGLKKVIILYFVSSFIASLIAVIFAFSFKVIIPGLTTETQEMINADLYTSLSSVIKSVVSNPVAGIVNGEYLPILFWAAVFGIILRNAKDSTKEVFSDIANVISTTVRSIVRFAPIGVLGLIFAAVSKQGFDIFYTYGKLVGVLVGAMLVIALIANPIIVFICTKKNPYPMVFYCLKNSGLNAFFTRSSAANIPINLKLCEEKNLDKELYSISIPLGATINMAGAAAVIAIMALSTCWSLGINVSFINALILCFVSTIAACGSAGTAGGSLMLIPLACSFFGIPSDAAWFTVGVGGQIGIIQDSVETAINSSSDLLFTMVVDEMEKKNAK